MLRSIKYELKPNKTQQKLMKQTFGCCRLVYNLMFDKKIKAYELNKTKYSAFDLIKDITELKKRKAIFKRCTNQCSSAINNKFRQIF